MSDIQQTTDLSDLDLLKSIIPQWKQSTPEPFLRSAQQDVVVPDWKKLDMNANVFAEQEITGGGSQTTIRGITIYNGLATYIQMVATPDGIVT